MTERIILDCDPGHDDVLAMILAAGDPHVDLVAVTTCAGNQKIEKVSRNARAVAGIDVPVAAGSAFVTVELTNTWTTGMTVTDSTDLLGQPHDTDVATHLDAPLVWHMTTAAIAALSTPEVRTA